MDANDCEPSDAQDSDEDVAEITILAQKAEASARMRY
jgi:hypothetical protein